MFCKISESIVLCGETYKAILYIKIFGFEGKLNLNPVIMTKFYINYRLTFFNLTLLICTCFPILIFGQSQIEREIKGEIFRNYETDVTIQYEYISRSSSSLTFRGKNGNYLYFENCTKNIASDGKMKGYWNSYLGIFEFRNKNLTPVTYDIN